MSKNCIITTVKSKIKGNATSYIERESEIFIPVSNKFSLNQTRAMAQDKVDSINKEYLSPKFGEVVSLNSSYTDGTGINIHPPQLLIDAYEVKEGNKTIEEVNPRNLEYFNGDEALLEQEQNEDILIQKELDNIVEQTNNIEDKTDTYFSITPEVNYNLKASEILSSSKADEIFRKGDKNNWDISKILQELQVPKDQQDLIKSFNTRNREEIVLELLQNYSYTVEIKTAKGQLKEQNQLFGTENIYNGYRYERYGNDVFYKENITTGETIDITEGQYNNALSLIAKQESSQPTQHYSNLTVPGGTNYTENEIAIPGVEVQEKPQGVEKKEGVDFVFEQNPELANIGTPAQYSQYLDTIFPDSKVKDIVYHHSDTKLTEFKKEFPEGYAAQKGVSSKAKFFLRQPLKEEFLSKRPHVGQYLINTINPNIMPVNADRSAKRDSGIKEGIQEALNNNQDGAIFDNIWDNRTWSDVLVVFEPEQIHILGGKQDVEGFKNFIKSNTKTVRKGAITPSIKGHAQFATENGIGWFRSDDKTVDELKGNWIKSESELPNEFIYSGEKYFKENGEWQTKNRFIEDIETVIWRYNMSLGNERIQNKPETKTRRILEVQSDLFQKGRDKDNLISGKELQDNYNVQYNDNIETFYDADNDRYFKIENGKETTITEKEFNTINSPKESSKNQFLQLLNKDNNWVTFFVKSIIQDSAKKGYEKVLFPSGNTASKVEGHTTLEEFKKQKEDRIKELEKQLEKPEYMVDWVDTSGYSGQNIIFKTEKEALDYVKTENAKLPEDIEGGYQSLFNSERLNREIKQLKQELERVEGPEGFAALKPIYNFYENTVTNILTKTYGKVQDFSSTPVKTGVDNLFEENKELSKIGNKQLYSAYLDTIFPINSTSALKTSLGKELEYKDPYVPTGSLKNFKQYQVLDEKNNDIGSVVIEYRGDKTVILHPKLTITGKGYGKDLYKLISSKFNVDIQEWNEGAIANTNAAKKMWDSLEKEGVVERIVDEEQGDNFRILKYRKVGSKQDVEGFKQFVKESSKPKVSQITDEYGNTWNEVKIKSEFKNQISLNLSQKSAELKALPNNQWFNRTIQPIINRFSKMFPNIRSVVISEKEIPNEVKSIVEGLDKQINSFFHKGQVYIIKERVTKDIAIEEFLHPFVNALEQDNPELYKSLLLEAKKLFPELKEEVFTKYGKVYGSIFDLNREFLTQALTKKVSEQTPAQETFFQKFKSWIKDILNKLFGEEAFTRQLSELDEQMSLTDLASILNEDNTQFNFNPDTNTTYYSLNEEEINSILNNLDVINATAIQRQLIDKILENNKVTQTDFTGDKHEYTRNELGEILQLKPVSSFLSKKINPELDFSDFAQIGNAIHEIVKNINLNLLPRTQLIDTFAEKSDLKKILVDEKGYPIETVKQILNNIYDYITPLIGTKESLLVSEVSISALQDLGDFKGVAGTIDLLEITKEGNLVIHDFKSMYLNGLETIVYTKNPSTQLENKFKNNEKSYGEQLSLHAKMLKGIVGNKNITLQIVPIGYLAVSETKDNARKVLFSNELVRNNISLRVENYVYSPFTLINAANQQTKFQVNYNKSFADKILPSIKDVEEKKLSKEEIDRQELLQSLTNKIKNENSKALEAEIEKVFKQVTTIVTQYSNSQNEMNKELFKLFDPKGELKETKSNFEAIFEAIKDMDSSDPERLKHYLSTLVQYINYIEETNVGLSNIKTHFYKIVANDSKVDNQTLIADMRRSYLLAKAHKERMNSILAQLSDIDDSNIFKQMLRKSGSYVDEIESIYFEKSLPLVASVINSYFSKEFRDNLTKEIEDQILKHKYDLNVAKSDSAKNRINKRITELEEKLKLIPNPNLIADIIQGKYGDSDWFYSNLMANINNPDYVISGTESFMIDIMRDLSVIALKKEEQFARQFSKREDTLKVNRDQVKEMNKDLVYTSNHLVKKADGTTKVLKSMTLLTEVNEDVYFDYEVLQDQLLKTEPNSPERKVIADKIKQFENEHFESEFNPKYLKALSAIDVVVSDGKNVKQVRQAILDKIKAIKVSNYKLNYLQGELESEDDLVELKKLWREFMNLSSTIDRNGNKKTNANLEIADILQARKKELEEFRDKKVDEDLWKKLKAKKIQSLLGKYNTEEEVLKSEEYKKWQSFNSVISPTEEFYELRQSKLNAINLILDKKEYKDIALVGQLKDNLNQSWEKLLAISREYRDFEREIISGDIPEGTKQSMKVLEENINKVKTQIKGLEKSLSKQDKKDLNTLWEEYNSMIEYKNSKYYEEDFENALNKYALENNLEVSELKNNVSLMTQFRLNNEWYINSHITKERFDKISGEIIKYSEPVYYYKVTVPINSDYIKESPASQYASFELKPEAYNLDENGNPNYLDVFGRKKVRSTSKYITENIPYLKIKNDMSAKGRVNFENLQFLKTQMEEAQKGLNKQNYLYYQIPAHRKSTFERSSEGDIKGIKKNLKEKFTINPQDEEQLGTRGVLANLAGEEAKFIPVLGKSKIDFEDQSYNVWKSILDYTMSATKAKMFEEKLPILDVLIDQLEKNLPAVEGNKNEAIGESMAGKFNLENVRDVIKGRGDKRVQAVKDTVSRYVYEEFTKELANIGGFSDIKITNTLLGYSGATMMVGNIPNWIVNAMSGNIQLMIEAAGKRYFNAKDLANAKVELVARHKDAISDYSKTHDKSLFGQLVEYFDPVKGEFMDHLGNKFTWSARTDISKIFFSGKLYGEWEMQMTTFIAMLKAKKVEQILPDGTKKMIDLYDAFDRGEDGVPKLKDGVQFSERELRDYMTKIQGVNKLLNGSYAKLDQTKIEKYSLGRMAIFMKKFFIPLFINRFGKLRGDAELQDVREGHYISFYNAVVKDIFNLPLAEIYAKLKKAPKDGGYTELQKTAIKKTLMEIAFITALTLSLMLLGYDDGEDDSDSKKFAQYLALKLRREVATFTPVAAPQEFASFFSRPFAAMSATGNLINLTGMAFKLPINAATGAFENDLYYQRKTSMWDKGDSKFLALLYKSIGLKLNISHPDQLLQGYNYSIRL